MIPSPVRARIARDAARACLHLLYRVRVAGASHVPTTGAVVLAANHTGYLDGALVFAVAPRPSHFLVLAVMFEGVVGRLMSWSGQIPIEQHRGDRRALGRAREVLDRGGVVGIFPEGGRGRGDFAVTGKGVAWLALQSGAPVVPTACLGTRRTGDLAASWPRLRSRMVVDFGAPVVLDLPPGAPGRTRLDLATAQLRAALVEHVHAAAQRHGIPLPADVPPDLVSWGAPAVGENGRMSTEEPLTGTADPAAVERALRAGLEDFDLSDEDRALLDRGDGAVDAAGSGGPLPVVAVIGRPNVGKSTLVNRVIGRREAVVEDVPGVTRDRVAYDAEWTGTHFTLVDTGGWAVDATGIHLRVAEQAEIAVELADAVLFVVDATVGATDDDANVVRLLRRSGKPVVLIANKVDDQRTEADAAALWNLGLGQPWPVSALHGRGSGDALDALLDVLPEVSAAGGAYERGGPRRVALLGRPNVGKSSMLNKLVGRERVVVDAVAGTTRDPVDELIELGGRTWRFVDTAGIRRRVHQTRGADFYASLRTQTALEKAEVAVVLVDASEVISEQDVRVIQQVIDAGRALVIAYNKWDLTDEERRHFLQREIERDLVQIPWAPRVNVSARTGRHMEKLVPALDTALTSWGTRISTGRLNAFLGEVVAAHPHPVRGGKQPRILFATQAGTQPPRFVLFASGFIEAGYRRFVERRLREEFGFEGTPIEISVRVREKRSRR